MKTEFEEFARAKAKGLVRTAFLLTGDRQDAEDLAQETLLTVYRHWRRVAASDNRDAYVHRALVNLFISQRRVRRLKTVSAESVTGEGADGLRIDDFADSLVQSDEIARAVAALPPRERAATVLRHYAHQSHAEIAAAMDTTESTARATASRAVAQLRQLLETSVTTSEGTPQ
jgi:RNA polymerase sigma-70 factor (sigma-E family)